jgi:hydroxyacyl-ACP dehydratase HTD2-like protein with hotdog domain
MTTAQPQTYLTDEIKGLVGRETQWSELSQPIIFESIRRFIQAIMDDDPIYWDEEYARNTKYKGLVCPPLFGGGGRRPLGSRDPLSYLQENPDDDGRGGGGGGDDDGGGRRLPPVRLPLVRLLNGGTAAEFFQLLRPGDQVKSKSRYASIVEREGREGKMVIITTERVIHNQNDELVAIIRGTSIRR